MRYLADTWYTILHILPSINQVHQLILPLVLIQRLLNHLHTPQDLLLLPPAAHDLHGSRQACHLGRVVVHPGAAGDRVVRAALLQCSLVWRRQRVLRRIDMRHWDNTGGVVEEVPEEGVSAG